MKELRFEQSYSRDSAGTYVKLPFDMPEGIERIEVEYDYPRFAVESLREGTSRRTINIVDLGLYGRSGELWGWSGSNQASIFCSSTAASPGYRHGLFAPGKWAVALGLYKIETEVKVNVTLRLYPREWKWYAGDLHMHTINSDGSYTTDFVMQSARKAGLDFIALTDHNNMKQNSEIGNPASLSVIPGVEYTNYRGHANFFFTDPKAAFYHDFLSNSFDEMAGLFRKAKDAGAIISLNHPISDCPWTFGYKDFPFDIIEVWNGPMRECNMKSINLWHEMLRDGKKISAVAGSDMHSNGLAGTFGNPCTMVYSESPHPKALLANLLAGRSSLSYSPRGPRLDLDIGGAGLGGTVSYVAGLEAKATITNAAKGDELKIISRDKTARTVTVPFNGVYITSFPVEARSFYRLEVYRPLLGAPVLCGLSNPVYVEET